MRETTLESRKAAEGSPFRGRPDCGIPGGGGDRLPRHEDNHKAEVEVEYPDRGSLSGGIRAGARTIAGMATTEDRDSLDATQAWREELYGRTPERKGELFSTISGLDNEPLVTPDT